MVHLDTTNIQNIFNKTMTPEEFVKKLQNKALEVERYAMLEFPNMAGNITLRFINGNFRAQGFQGTTFKKWKPSKGTTLVKTGTLRSATAENPYISAILFTANGWYFSLFCLLLFIVFIVPFVGTKI